MSAAKERPILFSAPMVRAVLAGTKTQTRRIVKPQPAAHLGETPGPAWNTGFVDVACPYGIPGDRLWVKETWRPRISHSHANDACDCADMNVTYAADGKIRVFDDGDIPDEWTMPKAANRGNVTPLFMPRWASRLTLEVTGARVQRLHDIGEEDARAEGALFHDGRGTGHTGWRHDIEHGFVYPTARDSFGALWKQINGEASLKANPWVWAVSFRRREQPITERP